MLISICVLSQNFCVLHDHHYTELNHKMTSTTKRGQYRRSTSTSSTSPTLEARLKNLFDDINNYLAFPLKKIVPARRATQVKRADLLMAKLDMYGDDDDMVEQLSQELVQSIRDYRNKLEIRANHLADDIFATSVGSCSTSSTASQVKTEELPLFAGDPAAFPVFLTAFQELIFSNDALSNRAKYRKLFFSLNTEDRRLLAQHVDPSHPSINKAIRLLRERYRGWLQTYGYIDVDDEDDNSDSDQGNVFVPLTDDEGGDH